MDDIPGYTTLPSASKDLEGVLPYTAVSAVHVDSPGVSSSLFSGGCRRKCNDVNGHMNLRDGSPLALGLGLSSISCTTTCLGKESEEESSIDLCLSINLNKGDEKLHNSKRGSTGTLDSFATRKPTLDLELSLSTRPSESDVTTLNHGLISHPSNFEPPALTSTVQLVDEGSTSSRWKIGPLVPPLQNFESSTLFYLDHGCVDPNSVIPKFLSSAVPSSLVGTASDLLNQQHKKSVKSCRFEGCTRGARGASGLCIAHGGGRRCQRFGCQKGAEGKTAFCKAHGGGRRCQQLGCTKSAEGRTEYCISHGGGRRCAVMRIAVVQQEVSQACVFVMGVAKGARWKIARRVPRVSLDSAYPMEVAVVANTWTVKRVLKEVPCFVKLTVVAEDAHLLGARKVLKAALHTVKAMVVGKDAHHKDAPRVCMGELYFVFDMVGARDALFLNVLRVLEGAQIIVSAMVGEEGASLKIARRVPKGVQIFARHMVEEDDVLGDSWVQRLVVHVWFHAINLLGECLGFVLPTLNFLIKQLKKAWEQCQQLRTHIPQHLHQ